APAPRAYTTYMTTLARLHTKRLLARRREGKTDLYSAVHSREAYADLRAQTEVEELVDNFGDVALSHFARRMAQLDPERRAAVVLAVTLGAAWRQARSQRRLLRGLPVAGRLPGHPGVWLFEAGAPLAFCAGWLRPRVFVSRAAVERLSGAELRAVLAHEAHHR